MTTKITLYGVILVIFVGVVQGQLEICRTLLQECNRDEFNVGNKRMVLFSKEKTWADAKRHCERIGMRLCTTATKEETDLLKTYLNSRIWDRADIQFWNLWLGANDIDENNVWVWKTTGQKMNYTTWAKDEPNGGDKENCLELKYIYYDESMWNDVNCAFRKRYICEMEESSSGLN